jgi:hypothetical protein
VGLGIEGDGLVAGVQAGHVALAAVYAEVVVYHWEFLLFRHVVDVLEVVVASASDILQGGHLGYLDLSWLLALGPEVEIVDEFLEGLAG